MVLVLRVLALLYMALAGNNDKSGGVVGLVKHVACC